MLYPLSYGGASVYKDTNFSGVKFGVTAPKLQSLFSKLHQSNEYNVPMFSRLGVPNIER